MFTACRAYKGRIPARERVASRPGVCTARARALLVRFSPWLEARWPDTTYDFYSQGAYALTMARFNGFFEEASALSAMVGVFFVPLAFGLLEVAGNNRRRVFAGFGMLACCMAVLTFCRSGTRADSGGSELAADPGVWSARAIQM